MEKNSRERERERGRGREGGREGEHAFFVVCISFLHIVQRTYKTALEDNLEWNTLVLQFAYP
jgi:hypothetical protein